MTDRANAFGARLKYLLEQRGMSQSDLAREAGILRDRVSYYINGGMPRQEKLRAIAEALGVAPADLMGADKEDPVMPHSRDVPQFAVHDGSKPGRKRLQMDMELSENAVARIMELLLAEMARNQSYQTSSE